MSTFDDFVYDPDVVGSHDPRSLNLSDEEETPDGEGESESGQFVPRGPPEYTEDEWVPTPTYEEMLAEQPGREERVGGILEAVLEMDSTDAILQVLRAACLRFHEVDATSSWPDLLACLAYAALPGARREIQEWSHRQEM